MFLERHVLRRFYGKGLRLIPILGVLVLFSYGCGKQTVQPPPESGSPVPAWEEESPPPSSPPSGGVPGQTGAVDGPAQSWSVEADAPSSSGATGESVRGSRVYTKEGVNYTPLTSAEGFREEGLASWYGKDFHGRQTANGERYDMYGMTAAHKILPFGAKVRVTSLENGKSVVVRINDRGPFVENRIIDLSFNAARQLDFVESGTARVRLAVVGDAPGAVKTVSSGKYYVQVGAFSVEENANSTIRQLRNRGYGARSLYSSSMRLWRVQVGPYPDLGRAEAASRDFEREGVQNFVVTD